MFDSYGDGFVCIGDSKFCIDFGYGIDFRPDQYLGLASTLGREIGLMERALKE